MQNISIFGVLPLLLLVQVGGGGGGGTSHCTGCDDLSEDPDIYDQQEGSCVSYTTAYVSIGRHGECTEANPGCTSDPCSPEVVLTHHQDSSGNGVTLEGIIGDIKLGPIKAPGGPNVEIFRGGTQLACGGTSPYYFEITGDCPDTDSIELVFGWFTCSACVLQ